MEAVVKVHAFTEQIELANPSLVDLATRYSFVPVGTDLVLTGGPNTATLTRTAGGFTNVGSLNHTFTNAKFVLPNQALKGVVVRCVEKPVVGDYVAVRSESPADQRRGRAWRQPVRPVVHREHRHQWRRRDEVRAACLPGEPLPAAALQAGRDPGRCHPRGVPQPRARPGRIPQYYFKDGVINKVSPRIAVGLRTATSAISEATMPASVARTQGGSNVAAQAGDYRKGFETLEAETEPAMVICPDALTLDDPLLQVAVVGSMVGHAERFRRFAIVDAPDLSNDQDLVKWRNASVDSTYAAVFAPHLKIVNLDPDAVDRFRTVPPSGFVAGVFARTDRERGVHKAPGNERVRGIVGLAENYTTGRQDLLNPVGVNLIRAFPARGTRLWGARNATDDTTWRYVNVRRLFNMIETSVERGTQWVVFEPNTRSTWLRVKVSMENFLDSQWRAGALAGASAAEAYRVRVGLGETMSETEIDLGLIVIEVAIAPAKPAEFVVFRFSHKRLSE